ncbi:MAG TPA: sialidase family protein [Actinomycetota bacterium]|nr:sialidase family protein [Actinomycetota bacterium]
MLETTRSRVATAVAGVVAASLAAGLMAGVGAAPKQTGLKESGGKAVAHLAGAKKISAPNTPSARWFDTTLDAGEPTIAHSEDGSVFFVGADIDTVGGRPNQVDIVRSDDKGGTWTNVSPKLGPENAHPVTLDPYIWMDKDTGRLFTIDLTVACSLLSFTDDEGASWITNPLACGRPVNDHQTFFGGKPATSTPIAYENVLYYCWNDIATSSCSKSINGGLTFQPTGSPAFRGVTQDDEGGQEVCGGLHGHGVVSPKDGTVFLPREYCGKPYVAISHDEGLTWEQVQVSRLDAPEGADPSVDVDAKGNVYYTWIGPDYNLWLTVSKNNGKSWGQPMMVASPGVNEANLPAIDVGDPGKIAIAYMGSENSSGKPRGEDAGDYSKVTWNGYITMSANVLSDRPVFYSGAVNDRKHPLVRGRCGPGRCGRVFDFIDVEIGPDGTPWGAYVDACIVQCELPTAIANFGDKGFAGSLVGGPKLR